MIRPGGRSNLVEYSGTDLHELAWSDLTRTNNYYPKYHSTSYATPALKSLDRPPAPLCNNSSGDYLCSIIPSLFLT